ncbi:class I adenylate-forming enzyme family protein [Salinisphaera aquimarina]|uniref:Class I adenylate-forming enzyme family protein n=1 Tax=Salinisphaera aquimarina TaxID=2094031 RepID=A0ABV7EHW3_9GAMM
MATHQNEVAATPDLAPAPPPMPASDEHTLAQVIEAHAQAAPDAPGLTYLGVSISYGDLDRWANRFANLLQERGIARGDVIGCHLPNTPQYVIALVAASKLGCPASGVSPLLSAPELKYQVEDAGIRYLVTLDSLYASALAPNDGQLPGLKTVIVCSPIDFLPGWKKMLAHLLRKVPKFSLPQTRQLKLIEFWPAINAAGDAPVHSDVGMDDVVLIQYTGGTTGRPKGAELTLRNVQANAVQSESMVGYDIGRETFASVFPYFHIAGLGACLMGLRQRARVIVVPDPRDLKSFCKAMQSHPPTFFGNVPTLYQMLLGEPEFRKVDFSHLKIAISGAGPMPAELIPKIEAIVGQGKFCEVYGLTETSPVLTMNPVGKARPGTIGVALPGTDIRIVDAENGTEPMPFNEPGELIAHGPQVFGGYLGLPDETAKALRQHDGKTFFYTGDIARMDADGYITICDRSKDMLIVGGYKVFSVEVENALKAVEEIEIAAVIGTPDEQRAGNDKVNLYVQLSAAGRAQPEDQAKDKIMTFCREHLAPYKVPKLIHFIDEMPLTPVGKLDKKALRH